MTSCLSQVWNTEYQLLVELTYLKEYFANQYSTQRGICYLRSSAYLKHKFRVMRHSIRVTLTCLFV